MTTSPGAAVTPLGLLPQGNAISCRRNDEDEACDSTISPLLLHNNNDQMFHEGKNAEERHQVEQEVEQIRRARRTQCLFGTCMFLYFIPTLMMLAAVSPTFVLLVILVAARTSSKVSRISSRSFGFVALFNMIVALCLYTTLFGFGGLWLFSFLLIVLVSTAFYHWQQQQQLQGLNSSGDRIVDTTTKQQQLFLAYLETVKSVAQQVQNGTANSQSLELREFHSTAPTEGFYKGETISPNKLKAPGTGNSQRTVLESPRNQNSNEEEETLLFLLFTPKDSGWWMHGARIVESTIHNIVLEGMLSPTFEVYWTEGNLEGTENTLYYGKFDEDGTFEGEWLSFTGNQSHQYKMTLQSPAEPDKHLGITCSYCQHNPHPGKCFISKAQPQHQYCETCIDNNPTLVQGADFFVLALPKVNRTDASYRPPDSRE